MGPWPMQLVVVMAVRKAVSAATITFTAISIIRFFIRVFFVFAQSRRVSQRLLPIICYLYQSLENFSAKILQTLRFSASLREIKQS